MTCDNCVHKNVCLHKEECEGLERSTKPYQLEGCFTLEVRCKEKDTEPSLWVRGPVLGSYQMP